MSLRLFLLECLMHKFNTKVIIQSAENSIKLFFVFLRASSVNDEAKKWQKKCYCCHSINSILPENINTTYEHLDNTKEKMFSSAGVRGDIGTNILIFCVIIINQTFSSKEFRLFSCLLIGNEFEECVYEKDFLKIKYRSKLRSRLIKLEFAITRFPIINLPILVPPNYRIPVNYLRVNFWNIYTKSNRGI